MPYAPGITYTGAESIARGLDTAFSEIAGGIMERSKKRQEKEQLAAATKALQPLVEKLAPGSGVDLTKDVPKEAVPQFIQLAGQIGEQQRTAPLRELQLENEKLRRTLTQQQIDEAAANAAATPEAMAALERNDAPGAFTTYLKRGGKNPQTLAQLGELAQLSVRASGRGKPGLQDFGLDAYGRPVQGLVDAQGNVSRITPPKDDETTAKPFQIGNRTLYKVGSDILDDQGQPVRPATAKQLDPFAAQALYSRYQAVLAEAAPEPKSGLFTNKEKAAQATAAKREQANFLAQQLGFAAPFPAAGTAPADPRETPSPRAETTAPSAAKAPATPYTSAEIAAELKRRGLAQ